MAKTLKDGTGATFTVDSVNVSGNEQFVHSENTTQRAALIAAVQQSNSVANGVAPTGNPLLISGWDGTLVRTVKTDTSGQLFLNAQNGGASSLPIQGSTGSGSTDAGNPVKIGGYASGTAPTAVTSGQRANAWYGLNGQSVVAQTFNTAALTDGTSNTQSYTSGYTGATLFNLTFPYVFNGTTWDRAPGSATLGARVNDADAAVATFTNGTAASTALFSVDTTGYKSVGFQLTGTWVGTVQVQYSDDNANWVQAYAFNANTALWVNSITANGVFNVPAYHRYVRAYITAYTSGTIAGASYLRAMSIDPVNPSTAITGTVTLGAAAASVGTVGLNAGTNYAGKVGIDSSTSTTGSTTATGATSSTSAKTSAGNLYGVNVVNNTTAGFLIALNLAAAPTASAAITASTVIYAMPVAASAGWADNFPVPIAASAGIQLVFSTSMTTYTVPATLPFALTAFYK